MWTQTLVRSSGGMLVVGGLLLLAFWWLYVILMPYRQLTDSLAPLALHRNWRLVNVFGVLGSLSLLAALPGLYAAQSEALGGMGLGAFLLALAASGLMLGPLLWDTVLWPVLAQHDPQLLAFQGPIYRSRFFVPFFASAGVLWAIGWALLAFASLEVGVLPRTPLWFIVAGAPLFALGSFFGLAQAIPRSIGISLFGVGSIWLGAVMWLHAPTPFGSPDQTVRDRLAAAVGTGDLPGLSVAVVQGGAVVFEQSYGHRDLAGRAPVDRDTVFLWMSMTKLVTATAIAQLESRGRLSLDDPAARYLPALGEVEGAAAITVGQLLHHTSGLNNPLPLSWVHPPDQPPPDATPFATRLLRDEARVVGTPGGPAKYSNLNYVALGAIVEAVDGRRFTEYVQQEVLTPLGMRHSGFGPGGDLRAQEAVGYLRQGSPFHLAARFLLNDGQLRAPLQGQVPLDPYRISGSAYGGLLGTAPDAARFLALHASGQPSEVLSQAARDRMVPADGAVFGLGWRAGASNGRRYHHHMGGGAGQFAQMRVYPQAELGVLVMANASGSAGPIHDRVVRAADLVAEAFLSR